MSAKHQAKRTAKIFLRPGTRRFKIARWAAVALHILKNTPRDIAYYEWTERTEPYSWSEPKPLKHKPKVSIIVPVFNPPAKYFLPMVYSVINQTYGNWELILVNASTHSSCRKLTEAAALIDTRVIIVDSSDNKG